MAETNRRPFDFAEGESELVSGFNVEYGRGYFAFIFIAEYSRMILIRLVMVLLFLHSGTTRLIVWVMVRAFLYLFVWMRVTYPRTRYDKLITLS